MDDIFIFTFSKNHRHVLTSSEFDHFSLFIKKHIQKKKVQVMTNHLHFFTDDSMFSKMINIIRKLPNSIPNKDRQCLELREYSETFGIDVVTNYIQERIRKREELKKKYEENESIVFHVGQDCSILATCSLTLAQILSQDSLFQSLLIDSLAITNKGPIRVNQSAEFLDLYLTQLGGKEPKLKKGEGMVEKLMQDAKVWGFQGIVSTCMHSLRQRNSSKTPQDRSELNDIGEKRPEVEPDQDRQTPEAVQQATQDSSELNDIGEKRPEVEPDQDRQTQEAVVVQQATQDSSELNDIGEKRPEVEPDQDRKTPEAVQQATQDSSELNDIGEKRPEVEPDQDRKTPEAVQQATQDSSELNDIGEKRPEVEPDQDRQTPVAAHNVHDSLFDEQQQVQHSKMKQRIQKKQKERENNGARNMMMEKAHAGVRKRTDLRKLAKDTSKNLLEEGDVIETIRDKSMAISPLQVSSIEADDVMDGYESSVEKDPEEIVVCESNRYYGIRKKYIARFDGIQKYIETFDKRKIEVLCSKADDSFLSYNHFDDLLEWLEGNCKMPKELPKMRRLLRGAKELKDEALLAKLSAALTRLEHPTGNDVSTSESDSDSEVYGQFQSAKEKEGDDKQGNGSGSRKRAFNGFTSSSSPKKSK